MAAQARNCNRYRRSGGVTASATNNNVTGAFRLPPERGFKWRGINAISVPVMVAIRFSTPSASAKARASRTIMVRPGLTTCARKTKRSPFAGASRLVLNSTVRISALPRPRGAAGGDAAGSGVSPFVCRSVEAWPDRASGPCLPFQNRMISL
jgi:hypothetical protein